MTQKQPMPLEDLPQYLKSLKESGSTGSSPVVNMGQITMPEKKSNRWFGFTLAAILCLSLGMGGLVYYTLPQSNQLTIIVDVNEMSSPLTVSNIVSEGGKVTDVKLNEDSTYEVKVSTRKDKRSFLEWLRGKKGVRKATIKE